MSDEKQNEITPKKNNLTEFIITKLIPILFSCIVVLFLISFFLSLFKNATPLYSIAILSFGAVSIIALVLALSIINKSED